MASTPLPTTTATVKSKYASKTNITAALLGIFGVLVALGVLPATVTDPQFVGSIVTAGSVLVVAFRTWTQSILK